MKSLIIKDLFNINHNIKSLLMVLVILAFCFLPQEGGVYTLIVTCGIIFSMMIITTFSFDDHSDWMKYALTMPVTRKDVAASKFAILLLFCTAGIFLGLLAGVGSGILLHKFDPASLTEWMSLLGTAAGGLMLSVFFGSISIPLMFRFGAEKARLFSIVSFALPVMLLLVLYRIAAGMGLVITEAFIKRTMLFSPVLIILWCLLMYQISCAILEKKDL